MKKNKNVWRGIALKNVVAALSFVASTAARADQFGLQAAAGVGDHHVKKFDLGVFWDPGLTWWHIGDGHSR